MKKEKNNYFKLLPFIKKHTFLLILILACIIVDVLVDIFFAKSLIGIADATISKDNSKLKYYLPLIIALIIITIAVKFFKTFSSGKFSQNCLYDIRLKTFNEIEALPIEYLDKHPSGDLVSRATSDLSIIQDFLRDTLGEALAIPLRVIVSIIFILLIISI